MPVSNDEALIFPHPTHSGVRLCPAYPLLEIVLIPHQKSRKSLADATEMTTENVEKDIAPLRSPALARGLTAPDSRRVAVAANTHIMYASAWRRYASSWRRGARSSGSRLDESCTRYIGDAASEPVILC